MHIRLIWEGTIDDIRPASDFIEIMTKEYTKGGFDQNALFSRLRLVWVH